VALAACLGLVCYLFATTTSHAPFAYDEADYMYAGTQGFWANYSDRNATSSDSPEAGPHVALLPA
jgi:hypothetical protein